MNYYKNFDFKEAEKLIRLALKEDLGKGDITSELLIPKDSNSKAELLLKEPGVIAGLNIFKLVFETIDKRIKINLTRKDGDKVKQRDVVGFLSGNTRNILLGERTALNLLQRMSGISTYTDYMIRKLNNNSIKIIDTRKTTPNMRVFEKLAVLIGGGFNNRFGLHDMVLIKDNHIEANGGIGNTLEILRKKKKSMKERIEIEVKNQEEFQIVISKGKKIVDRVMLDNFDIKKINDIVRLNNNSFELEISGGINAGNISKYKNVKGIDYISIGSLTHSVKSLDISLDFIT